MAQHGYYFRMPSMGCLLWGTCSMTGAKWGNRNPIDYVKGAAQLIFGVCLTGLMRTIWQRIALSHSNRET